MLRRSQPALSRPPAGPARSRRFSEDPHARFWWHHGDKTDYVPSIYQVLSDDEWQLMEDWYADTLGADSIGEINVPAMSMLQAFISGGAVTRVVQLGHYYGYSTLLIGFWLRHMDQGGKLVSIDIDPKATAFTGEWVRRAGLEDHVALKLGDSAAEESLADAAGALGGAMPQLILLDSSHQYAHTLRELDLWVPRMDPQTIMLLHDTSTYARSWDSADAGGVQQALDDWLPGRTDVAVLNLNRRVGEPDVGEDLVYRDGCGLGILQKL
jgi:predicted O-methyltransferase YrrM